MNKNSFYSKGKLLITGEYAVIKGAKALALPLNLGQSMAIEHSSSPFINWITKEQNSKTFGAKFSFNGFRIIESSDQFKSAYIQKLLLAINDLNESFFKGFAGINISTNIEFNSQWGFGSSSTLISNLAQWAKINPYALNNLVSKGSGYDIACATANNSIIYNLKNGKPIIENVAFTPPFIENLVLVYLNKKMPTEKNISKLEHLNFETSLLSEISDITTRLLKEKDLLQFASLMNTHEKIISNIIGILPVKKRLFIDFKGAVKSLGAWGGDFVLACSTQSFEKQREYFNNKGYKTVIPLGDLYTL